MKKIASIFQTKLKLYSRDNYDGKIKFKYIFLFLPVYLYSLYSMTLFNHIYYSMAFLCLLIFGLDYHSITNKSNVKTIFLFNQILNKSKSIKINLTSDFILKFILILPTLFFTDKSLLLFIFMSVFIIFSFFYKELVSKKIIHKTSYYLFIAFFVFVLSILGNFDLSNLREKQIEIVKNINYHFYEIFLSAMLIQSFLLVISFFYFFKKFDKLQE